MKFLVIGDLHGVKPKIKIKDFDAILCTGDFCSSDEIRKYAFEAIRLRKEKPEIMWYDICGEKKAKEIIDKSNKDGRKVLEFLNSLRKPVFVVPGNIDWTKEAPVGKGILEEDFHKNMIKNLKNIKDVHGKILNLKELQIIGYGISSGPEYPVHKEEINITSKKGMIQLKKQYNDNFKKLSKLFKKSKKPIIFLSHNVPYNTKIDIIINPLSPRNKEHYGSILVRNLIEKFKPLISIAGHMHEHFGKCKIGKTICINAGFRKSVLLEIVNGKIKKMDFIV